MRVFVKLGALWLLLMGTALSLGGAFLTMLGVAVVAAPSDQYTLLHSDDGRVFLAMGVLTLAMGIGHVAAFAGMWNLRTWGRWLGAATGASGLVGMAWYWGQYPTFWVPVVPACAYGQTLVVAIAWLPTHERSRVSR